MVNPSNTVTKEKITELLKLKLGLSSLLCEELTSEFFAELLNTTKTQEKIMLKNFGKFYINHKKARPGFNIKTGHEVEIKSRKVLRFTASRSFKDMINSDVK